jgi:Ser/Thr protein kinase RdoA (MazF antagonist)
MRGVDSSPHQPPYAELTPDCVLDALSSVGLSGDGRLLSLNSYENRVYQVWLDEGAPTAGLPVQGSSVVAKFYRPRRWSDAQIAEEHAFVSELAELEIPVVAPFQLDGKSTIASFRGFRFAVYPRCGGRAPELEDKATLEWMGRFIGRIHRVGAGSFSCGRNYARPDSFAKSRATGRTISPGYDIVDAWKVVALALTASGAASSVWCRPDLRPRRLPAGNVLWNDAGPHFVDLTTRGWGLPFRIVDAVGESRRIAQLDTRQRFRGFPDSDDRELSSRPYVRCD